MDPGFAIFLTISGGVVFLIGAIVAATNIKNMKRRARILATPTSPIAQAPGNGPVEVKGRVVAGEQGVVQAPFSGRLGVWVRVLVEEYRSTGRSGYWAKLVDEVAFRPFFVDDGSGQMARIEPGGANVILDQKNVASSGMFNDASPAVQSFLASRGLSTTSFLGFNKRMRMSEQVISPEDPLYALGPSRRQAGPPVHDGYRMVPGSLLVMYPSLAEGEGGELIITNKSEEQLVSKFFWTFTGGLVAAGVGALAAAVGLVGMLLSD